MTYDKETAHREIRAAIAAWVLDPTLPEPEIQQHTGETWGTSNGYKHFLRCFNSFIFRLKPKPQQMILINGIKVPAPEQVVPEIGSLYFTASPSNTNMYVDHHWANDFIDKYRLEKGLVYRTAENAIARSKAMLVYEVVV
jgi:hypothetical protein